eukprot:523982-Prorocentrum_minimum.AAC.4
MNTPKIVPMKTPKIVPIKTPKIVPMKTPKIVPMKTRENGAASLRFAFSEMCLISRGPRGSFAPPKPPGITTASVQRYCNMLHRGTTDDCVDL